jgi:hypothetical protein
MAAFRMSWRRNSMLSLTLGPRANFSIPARGGTRTSTSSTATAGQAHWPPVLFWEPDVQRGNALSSQETDNQLRENRLESAAAISAMSCTPPTNGSKDRRAQLD